MSANKTKLVIFDFDGTLTKPHKLDNSWTRIWNKIGLTSEEERLYHDHFKKGEISYQEWVGEVIKCFRAGGVNRSMIYSLAKETKLLDNCKKVFKTLYQHGIKICILSGGVKNIIDEKLKSMSKFITKIEALSLTFDENGLINGALLAETNTTNKSDFILKQMEKFNLKKEEVIFVGNSSNDENASKSGVTTICLNPLNTDFQNKAIWTQAIEKTDDLSSLLSYINF